MSDHVDPKGSQCLRQPRSPGDVPAAIVQELCRHSAGMCGLQFFHGLLSDLVVLANVGLPPRVLLGVVHGTPHGAVGIFRLTVRRHHIPFGDVPKNRQRLQNVPPTFVKGTMVVEGKSVPKVLPAEAADNRLRTR